MEWIKKLITIKIGYQFGLKISKVGHCWYSVETVLK